MEIRVRSNADTRSCIIKSFVVTLDKSARQPVRPDKSASVLPYRNLKGSCHSSQVSIWACSGNLFFTVTFISRSRLSTFPDFPGKLTLSTYFFNLSREASIPRYASWFHALREILSRIWRCWTWSVQELPGAAVVADGIVDWYRVRNADGIVD